MQWGGDLESDLIVHLNAEFNEAEVIISVVVDKVESSLIDDISNCSLRDAGIGILVKLVVNFVCEFSLSIQQVGDCPVLIDAHFDI